MHDIHTVSVFGLGYIGLPTAATLANLGLEVTGIDVKQDIVETINNGAIHIHEHGLESVVREAVRRGNLKASLKPRPADAHIITVMTPIAGARTPDLSFIESATRLVAQVLKPGDLVIVESTVPPGTCKQFVAPLLRSLTGLDHTTDYHLAHCPERVIPGRILHELVHNDRIIGGTTPAATARTSGLYARFVRGNLLQTDATTAELCKLMENTFRDVNIALVNELARIAGGIGVDIDEAIELANHHPRVHLHKPGIGVGGHCIPIDPWFIAHVAPETANLIAAARRINDRQPALVAEQLISLVQRQPTRHLALLGLSYKADVDDLRESPALDIAVRLATAVTDTIWIVEPYISALPGRLAELPNVVLVEQERAVRDANTLVTLVAHRQFEDLAARQPGQVVLDARRLLLQGEKQLLEEPF